MMDLVKSKIDIMAAAESQLLETRTNNYVRLSYITPLVIIMLFLGALLILYVSYIRLNNSIYHAQELQKELKTLVMEAPAVICLLEGPDHIIKFANDMYIKTRGKKDILGQPFREAFPERGEKFLRSWTRFTKQENRSPLTKYL